MSDAFRMREGLQLPQLSERRCGRARSRGGASGGQRRRPRSRATRALIPTGFAHRIAAGLRGAGPAALGLGAEDGVTVLNSPGHDRRGLPRGNRRHTDQSRTTIHFPIRRGARIAQLVVSPVERVALIESDASHRRASAAPRGLARPDARMRRSEMNLLSQAQPARHRRGGRRRAAFALLAGRRQGARRAPQAAAAASSRRCCRASSTPRSSRACAGRAAATNWRASGAGSPSAKSCAPRSA